MIDVLVSVCITTITGHTVQRTYNTPTTQQQTNFILIWMDGSILVLVECCNINNKCSVSTVDRFGKKNQTTTTVTKKNLCVCCCVDGCVDGTRSIRRQEREKFGNFLHLHHGLTYPSIKTKERESKPISNTHYSICTWYNWTTVKKH